MEARPEAGRGVLMALAPSTIPHDAAAAFSKAKDSLSLLATNNELQGRTCTNTPALQTHSNPAELLLGCNPSAIGGNLPVRAFISGARLFHPVNLDGSRRLRSQPLAHDHFVNSPVNALHLSRLSSSGFLVGIDPNEIGLTHAQISFAPGAKAYD